jgi:hypothetical protein
VLGDKSSRMRLLDLNGVHEARAIRSLFVPADRSRISPHRCGLSALLNRRVDLPLRSS